MNMFPGVITALVTPFREGRLDLKSFENLVRTQLDHGVQGFVVAGTTGESPALTEEERQILFEKTKAIAGGKVPILMGTGANSTAQTVLWTRQAEKWGADGALIVSPYYNKPPQRGIVEHFKVVARETSLPILLYNVPGRTASDMSVETVVELSQVKNIVGIKEATGKLDVARELVSRVPQSFSLISGDDGTCLEFMRLGGVGVISVLSHVIPAELRKMSDMARKGESVDFSPYARLTDLLFSEANPIPVKAACQLMGLIASDELRLPLMRLAENLRTELAEEMKKAGVLS